MVNPFLSSEHYDTETALMLERAYITDIGNAVAYTDGKRIFLNTQDNLFKILPAYDDDMLFWLLWHERMHLELKHHNRFFKYVEEFEKEMHTSADAFSDRAIELHAKRFNVSKEDVNIIMDILVHDWMAKKFPDKVETAKKNLAQFRDRNSLSYTFETHTLEEMLDEYAKFKHKDDEKEGDGEGDDSEDKEEKEDKDGESKSKDKEDEQKEDEKKEDDSTEKAHTEGGYDSTPREKKDKDETTEPESEQPKNPGHHDETDWSRLDGINSKEFITESEGNRYVDKINELKNTKIRLAQITQTLNGLVTDTKVRSYKTPNYIMTGQHTILKGAQKGKASLYLCFDASGSMSEDMDTFKEIISNAIPQAMKTPTTWFSGWAFGMNGNTILKKCQDPEKEDYYKGTFTDFMHIAGVGGYSDDGDRTIELCFQAEQQGYSPIGITDGGGRLSWSIKMLKQLKRTVLVGADRKWLNDVQKINPHIQVIYTGRGY